MSREGCDVTGPGNTTNNRTGVVASSSRQLSHHSSREGPLPHTTGSLYSYTVPSPHHTTLCSVSSHQPGKGRLGDKTLPSHHHLTTSELKINKSLLKINFLSFFIFVYFCSAIFAETFCQEDLYYVNIDKTSFIMISR